jgi:hypothetical protein
LRDLKADPLKLLPFKATQSLQVEVTFARQCWSWQLRGTFAGVRSGTHCGDFPSRAASHKTEFMALEEEAFQLLEESTLKFEDPPLP